ncbi:MAG: hypothetical protein WCG06_04355, partial [Candidatus Omnitrophota bacterium]
MKMCRVRAATVAIAVILFAGLSLDALAFTLSNFQNPQCVRVDPDDNVYYVTNLAGGAEDKNREGYVSKISPNGSLVFQKWIGGKTSDGNAVLDSPKGLAIYQGLLYIADAREIKIFSKKTMKLVRSVDLAPLGARSLSNLAVDSDGGFLYVSDPFGNQIFRIDIARNCLASVYKRTSELGSPKGIIVNPRNHSLMV